MMALLITIVPQIRFAYITDYKIRSLKNFALDRVYLVSRDVRFETHLFFDTAFDIIYSSLPFHIADAITRMCASSSSRNTELVHIKIKYQDNRKSKDKIETK